MHKHYVKDMESAFIYISSTIPPHSLKLVFTPEEKERLVQSPLFKTVNEVNSGKQLTEASQQIFHKLSHHALILEQKSPSLKTNKKDLLIIKKAAQTGGYFSQFCINE